MSDEEEVEDENGDEKDELENQEDQVSSGDQKNSEDITGPGLHKGHLCQH